MAILRCIGRTNSYGDPATDGDHIGFILQYPNAGRHTIVLEPSEAESLAYTIESHVDEIHEEDDEDNDDDEDVVADGWLPDGSWKP